MTCLSDAPSLGDALRRERSTYGCHDSSASHQTPRFATGSLERDDILAALEFGARAAGRPRVVPLSAV